MSLESEDHELRPDRRHHASSRKSHAHTLSLAMMTAIASLFGGLGELARVQEPEQRQVLQARSMRDILDKIQYVLGTMPITELWAQTQEEERDSGDTEELLQGLAACAWEWSLSARQHPIDAAIQAPAHVQDAKTYLELYRLNEAQTGKDSRCNNHAQTHCDRLEHLIPMYLLSIWPKAAKDRICEPWHQMAVSKLGAGRFLIIDNNSGIFWHGSLSSYVEQYDNSYPMEIIPRAGIAPALETVHPGGAAMILAQTVYGIRESGMASPVILSDDVRLLASR